MGFLKRKDRVGRQVGNTLLESAVERAETRSEDSGRPFADQCVRVCTAQGRKAHLQHPELGVLCGWPARAWLPVTGELVLCRDCDAAARGRDGRRAS